MFQYFTNSKEQAKEILIFFLRKKINVTLVTQYSNISFKDYCAEKICNLGCKENYVYLFQWNNKKIKQEDLERL